MMSLAHLSGNNFVGVVNLDWCEQGARRVNWVRGRVWPETYMQSKQISVENPLSRVPSGEGMVCRRDFGSGIADGYELIKRVIVLARGAGGI